MINLALKKLKTLVYLVCISALALNSCSSVQVEEKKTADFHLITEPELHETMQTMANQIAAIALLSLDSEMNTDEQRARVLNLLDGIQASASELDGNGAVTNYSVVNRYMGSFLYDVELARQFVNRQPPNLIPAQRLVKSCLACHESI